MAQLTLALFSLDPHQLHDKPCTEVSSVLLPQLAATRPYVNAAAGALGAAYDKCILRRDHRQDTQLITKLYLSTLRQVQHELQRPEPELVPLLMAALLLAAAESLQHKPKDALSHILGAFSMISGASPAPMCATSLEPVALENIFKGLGPIQDVVHSVDYHISMFAWGRQPQFPPLPVKNQTLYPASIEDLTIALPALQQWSLHFIAKALMPEWEESIDFPPELMEQQDHLVAWLKRWLRTYSLLFNIPTSKSRPIQTPHFRILKAQTLAMFIAVSNVKPPSQVTYDMYAPQFEDIIHCAEHIINPSDPTSTSVPTRTLLPYSPVPGIIHPLFFTARKYRDPVSRRRAIHLLQHAGIEGPFHGAFEARVAARLVEIEEARTPFKPILSPEEILPTSAIQDRHRVYMCWIAEPSPLEDTTLMPGTTAQRVMKFSRRRLEARTSRHSPGERVHHLFQNGPNGEGEMWDTWEEVIEGP